VLNVLCNTVFAFFACSVNIYNRDADDIEVTLSKLRQFGI